MRWWFPETWVLGYPKSSILMGLSRINRPFWGTPPDYGNPQMSDTLWHIGPEDCWLLNDSSVMCGPQSAKLARLVLQRRVSWEVTNCPLLPEKMFLYASRKQASVRKILEEELKKLLQTECSGFIQSKFILRSMTVHSIFDIFGQRLTPKYTKSCWISVWSISALARWPSLRPTPVAPTPAPCLTQEDFSKYTQYRFLTGDFPWFSICLALPELGSGLGLRAAVPSSGYGGPSGLPGGFPNLPGGPGGLPPGMANNPMMQQVAGAGEETLENSQV